MRRIWNVVTLLVAGCGMEQADFATAYATKLCELELTCGDAAELTFNGILTVEDCLPSAQYQVSAWGQGCRYRPSDATVCLEEWEAAVCPAAVGDLPDRPLSCAAVFYDCGAPAEVEAE